MRERLHRLIAPVRPLFDRVVTLEVFDRAIILGAQAFGALVPLMLVLASITARDGTAFGRAVVDRFDLSGDAADAVEGTFRSPADEAGITLISGALVLVSALSFTRAMQRTYELTWNLERRGIRGSGAGAAWLLVFAAYVGVEVLLTDAPGEVVPAVIGLGTSFVFWLATPYVLLARRVPWRDLIPQAGLSALGMTALGLAFLAYLPPALDNSAGRFGAIGVAFTLLSSLWAAGLVLVFAAAIGSSLVELRSERAQSDGRP